MKWSFIIPYLDGTYLDRVVNSIRNQNNLTRDNFEIILIGPNNEALHKVKSLVDDVILFNETIIPGWITMKKNLGVLNANYENLCIMHDYVGLCENWYNGYMQFGTEWDVCLNSIRTSKGSRFWDWMALKRPPLEFISYNDLSQTKTNMYASGTYWCAKKQFMLDNPLDIKRVWGEGEDIEWSLRCMATWNFTFNPFSVVKLMKDKEPYLPFQSSDPNAYENYRDMKIQE